MIPAFEALQLPSAALSDEERVAVDKLEAEIDEQVRKTMQFRGIQMSGKETRQNVLSAVNHRLVAAGYTTEWKLTGERNRFNAAAPPTITGFELALMPNEDAYRRVNAH